MSGATGGFIPIIILVVTLIVSFFLFRMQSQTYDYVCEECGERFSLTTSQAMFAPHSMGRKYVRCPHCGQMSWADPVPKDDE